MFVTSDRRLIVDRRFDMTGAMTTITSNSVSSMAIGKSPAARVFITTSYRYNPPSPKAMFWPRLPQTFHIAGSSLINHQ